MAQRLEENQDLLHPRQSDQFRRSLLPPRQRETVDIRRQVPVLKAEKAATLAGWLNYSSNVKLQCPRSGPTKTSGNFLLL